MVVGGGGGLPGGGENGQIFSWLEGHPLSPSRENSAYIYIYIYIYIMYKHNYNTLYNNEFWRPQRQSKSQIWSNLAHIFT